MLQVVHKFKDKHFDRNKPFLTGLQFLFAGDWRRFLIPTMAALGLVGLFVGPQPVSAESTELQARVASTGDITVTVGSGTIALDLTPGFTTPAFEASNTTVSVGTSNATGYTLTMYSTTDELVNEDDSSLKIATLSAACASGCDSNAFETNAWGYSIGSNNTSYKPFPGSSDSYSIQVNDLENGEGDAPTDGDVYTLNYAAKVNQEKAAGTYASTINFVAVANATSYTIHFNANSESATGEVADVIMTDTGSNVSTTLPSSGFSRTDYVLNGWNTLANGTGTHYALGGNFTVNSGQTGSTTLYAEWVRATREVAVTFAGSGVSSVAFSLADSIDNGQGTPSTITSHTQTVSTTGGTATLYSGATYNIEMTLSGNDEFESWSATSGTIGNAGANPTTYIVPSSGTPNITATGRSNGFTYSLTFEGNGGTPSSASLSGTAASVTLPTATYHTASTTNTGTRYATLAGWSETPNATTATYSGTMTLTEATTKTLYAVWNFNSGTLQNTSSTCGNNMIDARTGVSYLTYTISSKCYMEQNLYLPTSFKLYAGDSNIRNASSGSDGKDTWTTPSTDNIPSNSYDVPYIKTGTHTDNTYNVQGTWYNYCAASAQSVCDSTNQKNAAIDVCPKGWRLPTNAEMTDVKNAARSNWKFTAGYYYGGSLQGATTRSYWWSATANDATNQYNLDYYSSNGSLGTGSGGKYNGFSVRCVRS